MTVHQVWMAIAVLAIISTEARAVVDAQFVPPAFNGVSFIGSSGGLEVAQSFTVGLTGKLTGFDIAIGGPQGPTEPLIYDIRATAAGVPTEPNSGATVLASGALDPSGLVYAGGMFLGPPGDLMHVELGSQSFMVNAGDVLALTLRSNLDGPQTAYNWRGVWPNEEYEFQYPDGRAFHRNNHFYFNWTPQINDHVFRIYVTPIPEPSTNVMFLNAALIIPWLITSGRARD